MLNVLLESLNYKAIMLTMVFFHVTVEVYKRDSYYILMMSMQQYCLRWNNHQPNFISVFSNLLNNETLVDVTLAAEGRQIQAHKVVLSACSTYFQSLFTVNPCQHPIVILKDIKFSDLKIMVDFMYYGEVNISQDQLPSIIKVKKNILIIRHLFILYFMKNT